MQLRSHSEAGLEEAFRDLLLLDSYLINYETEATLNPMHYLPRRISIVIKEALIAYWCREDCTDSLTKPLNLR